MKTGDDFSAKLKQLGFTEDEVKIYFSLLNETEGRDLEEILERAKISSERASSALSRLISLGALTVNRNRFEAQPPKKMLSAMLTDYQKRYEDSLGSIRRTINELQAPMESLYWERRHGIRPSEILEMMNDLTSMEVKTAEIIAESQKEILIFAGAFGWYNRVRESLIGAIDRKVTIRVLMMSDPESESRAKDMKELGILVRRSSEEWYPVRGTLVDDNGLVFLIWATRKEDVPRPVHYRPHYTQNAGLVKVFRDAFEKRWDTSTH